MNGDAARRPQYTADQREEALRLYLDVGPAEASRECNIPATTIRSWAHRKGIAATVPPSADTKAATAFWVYVLGPLLGAVLGALAHQLVRGDRPPEPRPPARGEGPDGSSPVRVSSPRRALADEPGAIR